MCVTPNCLVGTLSVHFDNKGVECDTPIWLMFKCNVYRQNETPKSHRAKSSLDNMFILNTLDLFHSVLSKKKNIHQTVIWSIKYISSYLTAQKDIASSEEKKD